LGWPGSFARAPRLDPKPVAAYYFIAPRAERR
jgi:hypothetical protein